MKKAEMLDKVSRRRMLQSAGVVTIGGGIVGHQFSESAFGWEDTEFVVEQNGKCIPVEPLSGLGDIVDLYDYTPDASKEDSQQSNTGLEESGVSRLFLYDGSNGFSLVLLQGGDNDEGGAASFVVCGLSISGEWVVLDDLYEGQTDEFQVSDQEAALNWTWGSGGENDGAVYRGFEEQFCVTIKPAFNEEAKLEASGSGEVTDWQILSGDANDPDITTLDMDETLTVRTGDCDSETSAHRCLMSTQTVNEPFSAEVTFCCLSVTVSADSYDQVRLNFLDGSDERILNGSYQGQYTFFGTDDQDANASDEVIRSVIIKTNDDQVEVENPNADRCAKIAKRAGGDDDEEPKGS